MNDKELLELAAKAAGKELKWTYSRLACYANDTLWNPLTDDGDALRLAVKLRMDVTFNTEDVFAFPQTGKTGALETINVSDPLAATRRAIVRAAAEFGKEMK